MDNLARKLEDGRVFQEVGHVVRKREDGAFAVRTSSGEYRARRAVSCLVEPEPGDLVLVATQERGDCHVLAILEREPGATLRLSAEGDIAVQLGAGRFTVAAQEGVDLVAGKEISLVSSGLRVNASEGHVVMERLSFLGSVARAEIAKVKLLASTLDSVLDRVSQKVKRSFRSVEEIDQVRAEQIDYVARGTMNLHGENAVVTAEELVKVDGEQIHVG